ncbi:uncharacterized protein LOC100892920 isoform X2 [Strongylocentrotus purpuratus]|uniref:Uncharacterized protein n=1 Tax=Strongylocentrotus purpuratus TaxID=7668 RepID=A0A7M7N7H3_STRPU|nr:uncharacterized protein LOC100892920 isoform X2 [Strongylocentrotus purpuratus]
MAQPQDNKMAEKSSEECRIPEEIKKSVRAVLLSKIGGVPLESFSSDFKKLAGYPLRFNKLGFPTLRQFLEAMPDHVRFNYSDEASKWMLYGIGDPNSYMSSAAKKAQFSKPGDGTKETRKRNRRKSPKSNKDKGENRLAKEQNLSQNSNTDQKAEGLRVSRSHRGLFSVCVFYSGKLGDNKHIVMQEVVELFATQGDVIEKSAVKNLMFFRFLKEEEAISVIKLYNGRCLSDGNPIRVQPATEKMASRNKSERPHGKPSQYEQGGEQQQHLQHLMQQHNQQHEQILAQHQMLQHYNCEPWSPDTYQYLQPHIGMQEAYIGMHGEPFSEGYSDYNGFEDSVGVSASAVVEICVLNLTQAVTKEDLLSVFWSFNPLMVRLRTKQGDGNRRSCFAFVAFGCLVDAHNAQANMQGTFIKGCHLKIEIAKTKQHHPQEEQVPLQQDKNLDNRKPRTERSQSRDHRHSSRSEDESNDSISAEMVVSDSSDSPSYMDNKIPVIDDSPYSAKASRLDDTSSSGGSEGSPVPSQPDGGMMIGQGRGSLHGHVSPSLGRGLAMLSIGTEKKKPRPSLADLVGKLHEL